MSKKYVVHLTFAFDFTGNQTELIADKWRVTDNALTFYLETEPVMVFNNRSWTAFYSTEDE